MKYICDYTLVCFNTGLRTLYIATLSNCGRTFREALFVLRWGKVMPANETSKLIDKFAVPASGALGYASGDKRSVFVVYVTVGNALANRWLQELSTESNRYLYILWYYALHRRIPLAAGAIPSWLGCMMIWSASSLSLCGVYSFIAKASYAIGGRVQEHQALAKSLFWHITIEHLILPPLYQRLFANKPARKGCPIRAYP